MLDLIAVGRVSVDLYGQQIGSALEDVSSFAKAVGGCPANVAIGASRLGLRTALISRVGSEHMGRFVLAQLEREGVSTRGVTVDPKRLTSLVLLGVKDEKSFPLIFYRENCADGALCEDDIDPEFVAQSKALLVTGTHFATPGAAAAQHKAIRCAKTSGARVILDIDYRPNLWGLGGHEAGEGRYVRNSEVTNTLRGALPRCDLIVGTEEEVHIAGGSEDTLEALREIRRATSAVIVLKRGPMGCAIFQGPIPGSIEEGIRGDGFPIDVYNVLGAGDAFLSGFLRGYLRDEPLAQCARYANACGAITASRLLCSTTIPTWAELSYFLANGSRHRALRVDRDLNQWHWATTRPSFSGSLMALAIDHRSQFERMAQEEGAPVERISQLKLLAVEAVSRVSEGAVGYGVLLDGTYGARALVRASELGLWIARPIERPGSRPLDFDGMPSLGASLVEWPTTQTVKCLCFYHPADSEELRTRQERELERVQHACRQTGHELLLEIICGAHGPTDEQTTAAVMRRLYSLGIFPDWWKLEAQASRRAWENCRDAIAEYDPRCRGIVVLGLDAPVEQLQHALRLAAGVERIRGFAVGRTIFSAPAREWLRGGLSDEQAISQMQERFKLLCDTWTAAAKSS